MIDANTATTDPVEWTRGKDRSANGKRGKVLLLASFSYVGVTWSDGEI
mgnify:CR=1 FL=1